MKFAAHQGRLVLVQHEGVVDVEVASGGRFSSDPMDAFHQWPAFAEWARAYDGEAVPFDIKDLTIPVPEPKQVFGIGANYEDHLAEAGVESPGQPLIFTKFFSSLTGPFNTIELPSRKVDWEVELVVVISTGGRNIREEDALSHVAGYTVGQDLSERVVQLKGKHPQFSMGKSFPGFAPIGPWITCLDEFADPNDVGLGCSIDGEVLQDGRTKDLIFSVPNLIAQISEVVPLLPGDLIFTGTPAGVGVFKNPRRYLQPGETLTSWVETVGEISNLMVEPDSGLGTSSAK